VLTRDSYLGLYHHGTPSHTPPLKPPASLVERSFKAPNYYAVPYLEQLEGRVCVVDSPSSSARGLLRHSSAPSPNLSCWGVPRKWGTGREQGRRIHTTTNDGRDAQLIASKPPTKRRSYRRSATARVEVNCLG